jgi:GAF domain-containing protein
MTQQQSNAQTTARPPTPPESADSAVGALFSSVERQAARVRRLLLGPAPQGVADVPLGEPPTPDAGLRALEPDVPLGAAEVWREFAAYPAHERSREETFAFVVDCLRGIVPAPAYFVYLFPGTDDVLTLEHAALLLEHEPDLAAHVPDPTDREVLRAPPVKVTRRPEHARLSQVVEWCGECVSVPLLAGETFVGVVLAGPRRGHDLSAAQAAAAAAFSQAAAAAARTAREFARLREAERVLASRAAVRERVIGSSLNVNRFVDLLLGLALSGTRSDAGFVAIADDAGGGLRIRAGRNCPAGFCDQLDLSSQGTFDWDAGGGDVLVVRDAALLTSFGVGSVLAVPVADGGRLRGVFCVMNFAPSGALSEFGLTMLASLSDQIKLALSNDRLVAEFTAQYLATVAGISRAYDARSPSTVGHSERVARLGRAIARQLRLPEHAAAEIYEAGLVHDAGMCGLVDTSDSFQADFDHPTIGASLIEVLPIAREIVDAVRTHHEWYNGWGFPQGLEGGAIPLGGQVLAIAEYVVESEDGGRTRAPAGRKDVMREVAARRGVQFAPAVVDALLALGPDVVG